MSESAYWFLRGRTGPCGCLLVSVAAYWCLSSYTSAYWYLMVPTGVCGCLEGPVGAYCCLRMSTGV